MLPERSHAPARAEAPRVLVVGHTYVVGANQHKLHCLARLGVRVGLLAPRVWPGGFLGCYELEHPYREIAVFPARARLAGRGGAYLLDWKDAAQALRVFRPDLVHVEQEVFALSAFQAALLSRRAGVPLTVFCWENMYRPLWGRWATTRVVLRTARAVVAGNTGAAELCRRFGYSGPVTVLPQLGVDTNLFAPRARGAQAGKTLVVGFVGRLIPEKGVDILVEAVAGLQREGLRVRLVICGSGPEEGRLRHLVSTAGLDGGCRWVAPLPHDRVPEVLGELDLLALPSRTTARWAEQFGHVLIEAMAIGVAAVGSRCGAIPDVIGRDDALFPDGDVAGLAVILRRAVTDRRWLDELKAYGLRRVRAEFTNEAVARGLLEVFTGALARGGDFGERPGVGVEGSAPAVLPPTRVRN